jgi:hypothetical protein
VNVCSIPRNDIGMFTFFRMKNCVALPKFAAKAQNFLFISLAHQSANSTSRVVEPLFQHIRPPGPKPRATPKLKDF